MLVRFLTVAISLLALQVSAHDLVVTSNTNFRSSPSADHSPNFRCVSEYPKMVRHSPLLYYSFACNGFIEPRFLS